MIDVTDMPDITDYPGPLSPREATELLRSKVCPELTLSWTQHAKEQLACRGLLMGDILHLVKYGFVHDEAQPATRPGVYKYRMECTTPNSGGRTVRIVVIPMKPCEVKIITVMWKDDR